MTLDRLLRDAGDHVDALIDGHLRSHPAPAGHTTPSHDMEPGLMIVVEQPPRAGEPTDRPPRRHWTLVAAAAAVVLLVAGIIAVRRDDEDTAADIPATNSIVFSRSLDNTLVEKLAFDGKHLWAVRNGSTFLLRMHPDTGEVIESFSLPEAATPGLPRVRDGVLYVPTTHGVVMVDTSTYAMGPVMAAGDGEVWSVAFTTDAAWLVRRLPQAEALERWNLDLTQRLLTVDLGPEESFATVGLGDDLYLATAHDGLRRYDERGTVRSTVPGVAAAWEMAVGEDGTLWVADTLGDLVGVDTQTDTVRSRISVSHGPLWNVAVARSSVWVTARDDRQLVVADPATGRVTVRAPLTDTPMSLVLVNGAAWVAGEGGWAARFVPG